MNDTLVIHPETQKLLDGFLGSPPHAVILAGEQGLGKSHIALMLATNLLSVGTISDNTPYFREIVPVKGSIGIDQVRSLIRFFQLSVPGNAAIKRVALLRDADKMGIEAQNAFLKLLEEPPEGSVLILTSSNADSLLPTIRSRAQQITVATPEKDAIMEHFVRLGHATTAVEKAALRYGGNIAAIATVLSDGDLTDSSLDLVKQVLVGTSFERLVLADGLARQKEDAALFVETLSSVALASLNSAATKGGSLDRWQQVLEAAYAAQDALASNANTKLVLTELMLSL